MTSPVYRRKREFNRCVVRLFDEIRRRLLCPVVHDGRIQLSLAVQQLEFIMSTVRIEKIKPHIGGIVHVAKEHLLDDETVAAVREALEDRGVLSSRA